MPTFIRLLSIALILARQARKEWLEQSAERTEADCGYAANKTLNTVFEK